MNVDFHSLCAHNGWGWIEPKSEARNSMGRWEQGVNYMSGYCYFPCPALAGRREAAEFGLETRHSRVGCEQLSY